MAAVIGVHSPSIDNLEYSTHHTILYHTLAILTDQNTVFAEYNWSYISHGQPLIRIA